MSYSFSVARPTKAELVDAIGVEMAKVVEAQPVHEADAGKAIETASSLIYMLVDDPAGDIHATLSGSIWKTDVGIQSLGLSVTVSYKAKE